MIVRGMGYMGGITMDERGMPVSVWEVPVAECRIELAIPGEMEGGNEGNG